MKKLAASLTALALAGAVVTAAAPAQASSAPGTNSLAAALAADGTAFDKSWKDYDIVEAAIGAVLKAKPDSPVAVLADGKTPVTAFIPNDKAFRTLVRGLGAKGKEANSEAAVVGFMADVLGTDRIESVLLYHVVPSKTIAAADAIKADGASLPTALKGGSLTVKVSGNSVYCVDASPTTKDAKVIAPDINKGNVQLAHGISAVLMPKTS